MRFPQLDAFLGPSIKLAKAGFFDALSQVDVNQPRASVAAVMHAACIYRTAGHGEADGVANWCMVKIDAEADAELEIVAGVATHAVQNGETLNVDEIQKLIDGIRQERHQVSIEAGDKDEMAIFGTMDVKAAARACLGIIDSARVAIDLIGGMPRGDEVDVVVEAEPEPAPEPAPEPDPKEPEAPKETEDPPLADASDASPASAE